MGNSSNNWLRMPRAAAAGACIAAAVGSETTHVVAAEGTSSAEAARRLGQEKEQLQWPPGIDFVRPEFISTCLAARKLVPPDP